MSNTTLVIILSNHAVWFVDVCSLNHLSCPTLFGLMIWPNDYVSRGLTNNHQLCFLSAYQFLHVFTSQSNAFDFPFNHPCGWGAGRETLHDAGGPFVSVSWAFQNLIFLETRYKWLTCCWTGIWRYPIFRQTQLIYIYIWSRLPTARSPPERDGSPGSTPFLSICKLVAAFLRSSLVFARFL